MYLNCVIDRGLKVVQYQEENYVEFPVIYLAYMLQKRAVKQILIPLHQELFLVHLHLHHRLLVIPGQKIELGE
jgi:hypothetical protein